jgi:hypothetical protein
MPEVGEMEEESTFAMIIAPSRIALSPTISHALRQAAQPLEAAEYISVTGAPSGIAPS